MSDQNCSICINKISRVLYNMQPEQRFILRRTTSLGVEQGIKKYQIMTDCESVSTSTSDKMLIAFFTLLYLIVMGLASVIHATKNGSNNLSRAENFILETVLVHTPYMLIFVATQGLVGLVQVFWFKGTITREKGINYVKYVSQVPSSRFKWLIRASLAFEYITAYLLDTFELINMETNYRVEINTCNNLVFDIGRDIDVFLKCVIVVGIFSVAMGTYLNATVKYPVILHREGEGDL